MVEPFSIHGSGLEVYAPATAVPGESMEVEVKFQPRPELHARQVRVELVGNEEVYQSHGKSGVSATTNTFTRVESVIQGESTFLEGFQERWLACIRVPDGAPPSCKGHITEISWEMRAIVDIPNPRRLQRRPDLIQTSPLIVFGVPQSGTPNKVKSSTFSEGYLHLEFPAEAIADKGLIQGQLRIEVERPFDARGVRIELVMLEEAGIKSRDTVHEEYRIEDSASYKALDNPSYQFSLKCPASTMTTVDCPQASSKLVWVVRAVIDRRFREDDHIVGPVRILNVPQSIE